MAGSATLRLKDYISSTDDVGPAFAAALADLDTSTGIGAGGVARKGGMLVLPRGELVVRTSIGAVPKDIVFVGEAAYQGEVEDVGKGTVIVNALPTTSPSSLFSCTNNNAFVGIAFEDYTGSTNHTFVTLGDLSHGFDRCSFQGGGRAVALVGGFGNVAFDRCAFIQQMVAAVDVQTTSSAGLNALSVRRCIFNNDTAGSAPSAGTRYIWQSGGSASAQSLNYDISDNWFANGHVSSFIAVDLYNLHGGSIRNNIFDSITHSNGQAVRLIGSKGVSVADNTLNNSYGPLVDLVSTSECQVGPNAFNGVLGGNWIQADNDSLHNVFWVPSGATYSIGNIGRNWVFGVQSTGQYVVSKHTSTQATWSPGTIASGSQATADVSCPNSGISNPCYAAHDQMGTLNLSMYAYVRTPGTVRVVMTNNTGAAVTVPSGTVYVTSWRED